MPQGIAVKPVDYKGGELPNPIQYGVFITSLVRSFSRIHGQGIGVPAHIFMFKPNLDRR